MDRFADEDYEWSEPCGNCGVEISVDEMKYQFNDVYCCDKICAAEYLSDYSEELIEHFKL